MRTLIEQIRAEYAEMPGLSVTLPQAQRVGGSIKRREAVFRRLIARVC
jgi:hypothetical protein